jgi:hypothetical protein
MSSLEAAVSASGSLAQRLDHLRSDRAFANYERVRDEVLRMKDAEPTTSSQPSAYWSEELRNFEYMLDASPLIIEKLRQHTYHVTGVRIYEYRSHAEKLREGIAEKLAALRSLEGDELRVAEPPDLGGFGFQIDGGLYNIDTLKFYEALIALEKGEVLGQFRDATRRVVIEIGSGWGGFAYQFHSLFPGNCYVLVDLPELFLFSAVYLTTLFPDAQVAFWDDTRPLEPDEVADYNFVFVPHTAFEGMRFEDVALAVNMVSFQEMTTAQVTGYAHRLHELGCRFLYSLNRDKSRYNPELSNVHEILATRYWLNEIPVLPVPYTSLPTRREMEERRQKKKKKEPASGPVTDYRHMVGWRRVDVE